MHIIIVGCGRTGSLLARTLAERGHQVVVVDPNPDQFLRLGPNFRGRTITGLGFDRDVLLRAGIENAQGVAAVTSDETANLLVAFIARCHFNVPNVVARLFEPERAAIYQAIGVPAVTAAEWRGPPLAGHPPPPPPHGGDTAARRGRGGGGGGAPAGPGRGGGFWRG